jgi:hypothetical protein
MTPAIAVLMRSVLARKSVQQHPEVFTAAAPVISRLSASFRPRDPLTPRRGKRPPGSCWRCRRWSNSCSARGEHVQVRAGEQIPVDGLVDPGRRGRRYGRRAARPLRQRQAAASVEVPHLLARARRTMGIMKQNLAWGLAYNGLGIMLAAFGLLRPVVAAAAMVLSSLFVVGNSLRLRRDPGR